MRFWFDPLKKWLKTARRSTIIQSIQSNFSLFCISFSLFAVMESAHVIVVVQLPSHSRLYDTMDCSMPGLPVPHHLLWFAQVHVHCIGNAFQPSPYKSGRVLVFTSLILCFLFNYVIEFRICNLIIYTLGKSSLRIEKINCIRHHQIGLRGKNILKILMFRDS